MKRKHSSKSGGKEAESKTKIYIYKKGNVRKRRGSEKRRVGGEDGKMKEVDERR